MTPLVHDSVPHRILCLHTQAGHRCVWESADECQNWANSHTPKPEDVSHDSRRSACASVASVWGSQHVMSKVTCTPTVHGPLGWVVACATRQGQCVRPAAPPRALYRSQRLMPLPPLSGGFGVRGCLSLHRCEAPRGLRALKRAAVATPLTPSPAHLHRGPSRYSRGSVPSRRPLPVGR